MKVMGIRLLLMAFLLALFELIVINIAGILPFLAAHKANISSAPFMDFVTENLMNPIGTSTSMIEKKNPLFFIGSGSCNRIIRLYGLFLRRVERVNMN